MKYRPNWTNVTWYRQAEEKLSWVCLGRSRKAPRRRQHLKAIGRISRAENLGMIFPAVGMVRAMIT